MQIKLSSVLVNKALLPKIKFPGGIVGPVGVPAIVDGHPAWLANGSTRPQHFDGKFLAAKDLERDQAYFAGRLAEHFRAAGSGVLHGLDVRAKDSSTLAISGGVAITPAGTPLVVRPRRGLDAEFVDLELPLFDIPQTQRLDKAFGLLDEPLDVPRRRTGVFVLLARPVEFSANPIGLYPAGIESRRAAEDGEIIEAVAFTLAPVRELAVDVDPKRQRAALARRIFVDRAELGTPVDAVPLAIVRLERGFIVWVDSWLVRREIGAAHRGLGSFTRGPRDVGEAHVQQFHAQLAAIAAERAAAHRVAGFTAAEELAALPPVGLYPVASLDLSTQSERFFPQAMQVSLQVVPDDELAAVLDEQLSLPPIDLLAGNDQLAAIHVAVLVAVPRTISEQLLPALRTFPLSSGAPLPGLRRVRLASAASSIASRLAPVPISNAAGKKLLEVVGPTPTTYYVRLRRSHPATAESVPWIQTGQVT